jgi:hypothetical protein
MITCKLDMARSTNPLVLRTINILISYPSLLFRKKCSHQHLRFDSLISPRTWELVSPGCGTTLEQLDHLTFHNFQPERHRRCVWRLFASVDRQANSWQRCLCCHPLFTLSTAIKRKTRSILNLFHDISMNVQYCITYMCFSIVLCL